MKDIILNNGISIPSIGFGTYKSTESKGFSVVMDAIRAGYRHLDTAAVYGNEEDVGRAMKESGIPRKDFFLTTKLDRNHLGYENAYREFKASLKRLGTDHIDLYLIHWPRSDFGNPDFDDWKQLDIESWKAMEELYHAGKIRSIGVSNFLIPHLENLMSHATVMPAVNQLELHPGYLQEETVSFCKAHGIALEAWSPIGRARLLNDPLLMEMAKTYHTTVADLCLTFDLESDFIILPKSTHMERMEENLKAGSYEISESDKMKIRNMPCTGWSGLHPDRAPVK